MDRHFRKRTTWGTQLRACLVVLFMILIIPFAVVLFTIRPKEAETGTEARPAGESGKETEYYAVCEQEAGNIRVPLEACLISILAGSMDADAPMEALRAMAILLRTQAVYEIESSGSYFAQGYLSDAQLKEKWGAQYETNRAVYAEAVNGTRGIIMTHGGAPIETAYHLISGGRTRDPAILGNEHALQWKAAECEQDMMAEGFRTVVDCDAARLDACLGVFTGNSSAAGVKITIEERDEAGYVLALSITGDGFDGLLVGGERFRLVFQLPSSNFTMEQTGDGVRFVCFGVGHGYGMSLYQARMLAQDGQECMDILRYFFDEIEFMRIA